MIWRAGTGIRALAHRRRAQVRNRTMAELHRIADDVFERVLAAIGGG